MFGIDCIGFFRKIIRDIISNGSHLVKIVKSHDKLKLHKILVSEEKACSTIEPHDMVFVQPTGTLWFGREWEKIGKTLSDGFRYVSNTNTEWLDVVFGKAMIRPFREAYEQGD